MSAKPFPFASLEAFTRADVAAAARIRRVARDFVDASAIEAALTELLGERVTIEPRRHRRFDAARGADDAIGVALAIPDERTLVGRVLVEVEGTLGAALAAKALRQRAPRIVDGGKPPPPAVAGAVAAVVVTVLRRAHGGAVPKVIAAGPGQSLARDMLAAERDVTVTSLTVTIGEDAFDARIYVPESLTPAARDEALSSGALAKMGEASIALPLVLLTTLASRNDLAALARGDAFVPARQAITVRGDRSLAGAVALVAPRSERGVSADLAGDGRLVIGGLLESHPLSPAHEDVSRAETPSTMTPDTSPTATLEAIEDAPVVVRVEMGSVEMTARAWSELAAGDVVTLGRKLGEPAILRVGGVELARGELVQVEGELAVRILGRNAGGGAR